MSNNNHSPSKFDIGKTFGLTRNGHLVDEYKDTIEDVTKSFSVNVSKEFYDFQILIDQTRMSITQFYKQLAADLKTAEVTSEESFKKLNELKEKLGKDPEISNKATALYDAYVSHIESRLKQAYANDLTAQTTLNKLEGEIMRLSNNIGGVINHFKDSLKTKQVEISEMEAGFRAGQSIRSVIGEESFIISSRWKNYWRDIKRIIPYSYWKSRTVWRKLRR